MLYYDARNAYYHELMLYYDELMLYYDARNAYYHGLMLYYDELSAHTATLFRITIIKKTNTKK